LILTLRGIEGGDATSPVNNTKYCANWLSNVITKTNKTKVKFIQKKKLKGYYFPWCGTNQDLK
jgi:hypothetical protein